MRRGLLALVVLSIGLGLAGCARKAEGGDKHKVIWKSDPRMIHREWDSWGWDDQDTPPRTSPYRDF